MLSSDTEGSHPRLHFGLGKSESVDIEVVFPTSKKRVIFPEIPAKQYLVLRADGSVTKTKFNKPSK